MYLIIILVNNSLLKMWTQWYISSLESRPEICNINKDQNIRFKTKQCVCVYNEVTNYIIIFISCNF